MQKNSVLNSQLEDERKKRLALEVKMNFEKQRQKAAELKAKNAIEAMKKVFTSMQVSFF